MSVSPRTGRQAGVLLLVGLLLSGLAASGAGALERRPGGLGLRLVDAPVARADDPRALLYVVDHVKPGASFSRRVEAINDTAKPIDVLFYPAHARVRGQEFDIGGRPDETEAPGTFPSSARPWMSVSPASARMAPGSRLMLRVSFQVPASTSAGEYYGAVVMEKPVGKVTAGSVGVNQRVGIRTYLSVGAGGEPPSDFTATELSGVRDAEGRPHVRVRVANTGKRALEVGGQLVLTSPTSALRVGPVSTNGITLAIGEGGVLDTTLDPSLPDGPWKVEMLLRSGRLERVVTGTVSFAEIEKAGDITVVNKPVAPSSESEKPEAVPPLLIATAALLLLLLLIALILYEYNRRRALAHRA